LIIHVLDLFHAEELADFNPAARRLARRFWPGPLTLVLPKKACVPGIVTSGGPTVAIRAPAHPLARRLLRLAKIPLAAPSANLFGYISPTTAAHVREGLGARQKFLGVKVHGAKSRGGRARQLAPGMLERHYSPRTPLALGRIPTGPAPAGVAVVLLRQPSGKKPAQHLFWLSQRGALTEVARNLYDVLRRADAGGYTQIRIEPLPAADASGLAAAINDRLKRAAAKR
jgi:L-threonylcarbamoyladenylate synthase